MCVCVCAFVCVCVSVGGNLEQMTRLFTLLGCKQQAEVRPPPHRHTHTHTHTHRLQDKGVLRADVFGGGRPVLFISPSLQSPLSEEAV